MFASREKPDCILVVGCSHAIPMFLAAKFMRINTIFVESITRADRLSRTGQLVRSLRLSNALIVQWPALLAANPGTRLGTIL